MEGECVGQTGRYVVCRGLEIERVSYLELKARENVCEIGDEMRTLKKCRKSARDAVNAVIACVTRVWRGGGIGQGGFESGASKRAGAWRMAAFICMIPRWRVMKRHGMTFGSEFW